MGNPVPTIPLSTAAAALRLVEAERDLWQEMAKSAIDQLEVLGKRLATKEAVAQLRATTSGETDAESDTRHHDPHLPG